MSDIPKGIVNLGNTCYLNACIQILSILDPLWTIVQKHSQGKNVTAIEFPLWKHWKEIMFIMQSASATNQPNESLYPTGFFSTLQSICKQKKLIFFQEKSQEDVSEFVQFFFQSLHACLAQSMNISIQGHVENTTDDLALHVCKFLKSIYEKEYSEIHDLFSGVLIHFIDPIMTDNSRTEIHYRIQPDLFFVLNLPLPYPVRNDHSHYSLYDCFNCFCQEEVLEKENSWYNEKTGTYENVVKYTRFWNFPNVLWIGLNRSLHNGEKRKDFIQYPFLLDLNRYSYGYKRQNNIYDLIGIVNHMGTVEYGHYTCFVKKYDSWYHCNDTQIQKVEDVKHLETPYACSLVYVKKNNIV